MDLGAFVEFFQQGDISNIIAGRKDTTRTTGTDSRHGIGVVPAGKQIGRDNGMPGATHRDGDGRGPGYGIRPRQRGGIAASPRDSANRPGHITEVGRNHIGDDHIGGNGISGVIDVQIPGDGIPHIRDLRDRRFNGL